MGNELLVLAAVSDFRDGGTVGQIQKYHPDLTVGQVKRILVRLVEAGLLFTETVKYGRTGKTVYRISEYCAMTCSGIARMYAEQ